MRLFARSLKYSKFPAVFYLLSVVSLSAQTKVLLSWDRNQDSATVGYKLYFGNAISRYDNTIDVGNVYYYSVTLPDDRLIYYFAVTAYDKHGRESGFSESVTFRSHLGGTESVAQRLLPLDERILNLKTPTVVWPKPIDITYGTRLAYPQLNASVNFEGGYVSGKLEYFPKSGTILDVGESQSLEVTFTPRLTNVYAIVRHSAKINVKKAPLTITMRTYSRRYGSSNPTFTSYINRFVNGENESKLDLPILYRTDATQKSSVGTYVITPYGASSSKYEITYVNGIINILPVYLTLRPETKYKYVGEENPVLTFTASGLVNGDTPFLVQPIIKLNTTAEKNSPPGTYVITIEPVLNPNYNVFLGTGYLRVQNRPRTGSYGATKMYCHFEDQDNSNLTIVGDSFTEFRLEQSSDLKNWTKIHEGIVQESGEYIWKNTLKQNDMNFFRVLVNKEKISVSR